MSTQRQLRRGTAAEMATFTGADGELVQTTDTNKIFVHDGATLGGIPLTDYIDIQRLAYTYAAAGGSADALTGDPSKDPSALQAGMSVFVKAASNNTGAATLDWGSTGAIAIKKYNGNSKVDVEADDIVSGKIDRYDHDGTHWIISLGREGGVLSQIASANPSAVSTVEFTNIFVGNKVTTFEINALTPTTDSTDFRFRLSDDSGISWITSGLRYFGNGGVSTSVANVPFVGQSTNFADMTPIGVGSGTDEALSGRIVFRSTADVNERTRYDWIFSYQDNTSAGVWVAGGGFINTVDVDTIELGFASGNIESGSITVFEKEIA